MLLLKGVYQEEMLDRSGDEILGDKEVHSSELSERLQLKHILKTIENEFDLNDLDSWLKASSKVNFVFELLHNLKREGHKVLIFSKTKLLLDFVEKILTDRQLEYSRLDGDVRIPLRDGICNEFNQNPAKFCFLLTAQVSGVGLNLCGADRAIILDPDWNPANDN